MSAMKQAIKSIRGENLVLGFSDDVCIRNIIHVTRYAYYFRFAVGLEGNSKLELAITFRDRRWLYFILIF